MKTIRVVAAIIRDGDRIFATQRGYGAFKDGWEFPGGKIEEGEAPQEAIVREIREELDAEIVVGDLLTTVEYDYPEFHLSMDCFWAKLESGAKMKLLEHEAAKWLSYRELDTVGWLPADIEVVKAIKHSWDRKYDAIALGELLIDFTESGKSADGMRLFEQNPGGAPANMLTALSHAGYKTAFIGKVGEDMHGRFLIETLQKEGIDTKALIRDPAQFTTLAFVGLDANGERSFSFSRKPGADTMLRVDELDREMLGNCRVFHFGSLSLTDEPSRSATLEAVRIAKASGAVISYDPNYRASLWPDLQTAVEQMRSAIPLADMLKVSDEESYLLTGCRDPQEATQKLLSMGPQIVAVTLGSEGVLLARREEMERVSAFEVKAVDTTGAGDAFWGGFLSRWLSYGKGLDEMNREEWRSCAVTGNAFAALCVQKRGGIPSVPSYQEVCDLIAVDGNS